MKQAIILAIISSLLLAAFLLIRPVIGAMGVPTSPDIKGQASKPVPDGTTATIGSASAGVTTGPSGLTNSKPRPTPADMAQAGISRLEEVERLIYEYTNDERRKNNRAAFDVNDTMLSDVARFYSDDMLYRDFFDHIDPDGLNHARRISLIHRRMISRTTGENIARLSGYDPSDPEKIAREIMYGEFGWMNSVEHRDNILTPGFTHLGVGVSIQGKEIRATQNFAEAVAFTDQPVPLQVNKGDTISLDVTSSAGPKPDKYDFWVSSKGLADGTPRAISDGRVDIGPGIYMLRFLFPDGKTFLGPQIEVK
jgi:uncharacterized protein YkwD